MFYDFYNYCHNVLSVVILTDSHCPHFPGRTDGQMHWRAIWIRIAEFASSSSRRQKKEMVHCRTENFFCCVDLWKIYVYNINLSLRSKKRPKIPSHSKLRGKRNSVSCINFSVQHAFYTQWSTWVSLVFPLQFRPVTVFSAPVDFVAILFYIPWWNQQILVNHYVF